MSSRNDNLSWTHHMAVAPLPPERQRVCLGRAEQEALPVRALRELVKKENESAPAVMPKGTYRVIYADPPWQYENCFPPGMIKTALDHYPTMPLEDICTMSLPKITVDAVLFLWTTAPQLEHAFEVIRAWGFIYKTNFVWDKVKHNLGRYISGRHEHLLIATQGSCTPDCKQLLDSVQVVDTVQIIERTGHSVKPLEFRALIDKLYPDGQRVELFARGKLPANWDGYGNEYVANVAA
jgi:N6-adenosine-specific RNA methylase IME4